MADRFVSPLRYPGGKRKIANYLKILLLRNSIHGVAYAEPFAGGAAVALSLLFEEYASQVFINDIDPAIASFWRMALANNDALCERIEDVHISMSEWRKQREILDLRAAADPMDLAFATFFLNRCNRSGIIRGGPIGGLEQAGTWRMDARFNKGSLIKRIQKVGRFADRISVTNSDAADLFRAPPWPKHTFVYADPPYVHNASSLYHNSFAEADHRALSDLVKASPDPWLLTYDDTPLIRDAYAGFGCVEFSLSYSAANRYRGSELMFFSADLEPVLDIEPAGVGVETVGRERLAALT